MTNWHRPEAHWAQPPDSLRSVCQRLHRELPARVTQHLWLAPLSAWLAVWRTEAPARFAVPLARFCSADVCAGGPGPAAWVIAGLPDPRHLVTTAQSTLLLAASRQLGWDQRSDLAFAVRLLLQRSELSEFALMTGQGLTCAELSRHAAHAFQRLSWEWIPLASHPARRVGDKLLPSIRQLTHVPHHARLFVLPAVAPLADSAPVQVPAEGSELPVPAESLPTESSADGLAFATAGQIYLLATRPDSRTWQLAEQVLRAQAQAQAQAGPGLEPSVLGLGPRLHVFVPANAAVDAGPVAAAMAQQRQAAQQLMQAGAVGWHLTGDESAPFPVVVCHQADDPTVVVCPHAEGVEPRVAAYRPGGGRFLAHHTRAIARQRPEEVEGDYWWRWLTETAARGKLASPTAWDTLLRIVCQQRLRAGRRLIPGQQPVVCFSGRCPAETATQRTFRAHLRRWDYEPYGVAIERDWLIEHGGRAVEYVEQAEPRHHFQQARYSRGSPAQRIDWSLEQEFRWEGDLDLRRVPPQALFYFVRTAREAQQLAYYTPACVRYLETSDPPASR